MNYIIFWLLTKQTDYKNNLFSSYLFEFRLNYGISLKLKN